MKKGLNDGTKERKNLRKWPQNRKKEIRYICSSKKDRTR